MADSCERESVRFPRIATASLPRLRNCESAKGASESAVLEINRADIEITLAVERLPRRRNERNKSSGSSEKREDKERRTTGRGKKL